MGALFLATSLTLGSLDAQQTIGIFDSSDNGDINNMCVARTFWCTGPGFTGQSTDWGIACINFPDCLDMYPENSLKLNEKQF